MSAGVLGRFGTARFRLRAGAAATVGPVGANLVGAGHRPSSAWSSEAAVVDVVIC
jgi:hypothetical protein